MSWSSIVCGFVILHGPESVGTETKGSKLCLATNQLQWGMIYE